METRSVGMIEANRCAGLKGRLQLQLFGVRWRIKFGQERFNVVGLLVAGGPVAAAGVPADFDGPRASAL